MIQLISDFHNVGFTQSYMLVYYSNQYLVLYCMMRYCCNTFLVGTMMTGLVR